MSKYNLGIVKKSILGKLNETASVKEFVNLVKESDLLKLKLMVFENIEKKYITNEDLASKYIDENLNLLKSFTKEQFEAETKKFLPLMEGMQMATTSKKTLFENLHILIYESLSGKRKTNVDKLFDAYTVVLEHIKNNKPIVAENDKVELPTDITPANVDYVLPTAINEFNKKYSEIFSEDEALLFKSLISEKIDYKIQGFKQIKESTLTALKDLKSDLDTQDKSKLNVNEQRDLDHFASKVAESMKNIEKLQFNESTFMDDALDLINLKEELSN